MNLLKKIKNVPLKRLKNISLPVKIAITATILTLIFWRMDKNTAMEMVSHFKMSAWFYAALFMAAQSLLLACRWQYLINIGKRHLSLTDSIKINLTSQLANLAFIASIGGMVARVALSVQHGASLFKTLIATVLDRLMTLGALVVLAAAFIPALADIVDNKTFHTMASYIGIFILGLIVLATLGARHVLSRLPDTARWKGRVRYGLRYMRVLITAPTLCAKIILVSVVAQMCLFLAAYCLIVSAGIDIPLVTLMSVLPMISLVAALPISIGGWGVREGAFIYGLGLFGVPMETAFLISVQVGLISMLVNVLMGIPALMTSNLHLERLAAIRAGFARIRS